MSYPLIINGVCYGMVTPKEEHYCKISAPETEIIKKFKEVNDKLARIEAQSQVNTDTAIERILNGGA